MDQHGPPQNGVAIQRDVVYVFPESACAIHTCPSRLDKILLVEQWRPAHGRRTLELPGGRVEAGESPEDAAVRELLEEVDISASQSRYILKLDLDLSNSIHCTHLVQTFSDSIPELNSGVHYLSMESAWQHVMAGEITHAPTVTAILLINNGRLGFGGFI